MNSEEYQSKSENALIQNINDFSDEQLNERINKEELLDPRDPRSTVYQNDMDNISQNKNKNGNIEITNTEVIIGLSNNKTNFTSKGAETDKYKRTDNLRKEAFFGVMIFLKQFFKERYNLNFDTFKCDEVFGVSIGHMKKILGLEIYQILCYYPENILKMINFVENTKMNYEEKQIFFYFMTRTYEELYNRYILGDINFPVFKGGTVRINKFITLQKTIKEKTGKLKKQKKTEILIETKIKAFEEISINIIRIIKSGNIERKERKEKELITAVIDEFEIMRNHFLENTLSIGIELEE